ncbi:MAG: calcium/sodium antiporter [Paracoccaceae bacterium]|uniref:calcium/sodium antiporter n=1 Tax=unclassified Seohaeicola TaxID=2641111 RepID=UPI00237ACD2A|nr:MULTISPECIES: calcium/sodium antiporter [unclassified Seohaeicola]MDD9706344.1 calcium/sodium antiporter [Seohaeicola sp. 4SK31]MDD9734029.1 calcium/sodium antiporter [Seohaeicola sp. SP36]MDF1707856.1 calcium/sodium antiporter [Paracoccaceae bacterium]MDM7969199.1 calcium/sodium antiporter [Paracoccaceae bacterium]
MVWLMAALGLVILLFAGDALVKGAVNLALRIGIPALIVSLTIVAFGTSAPELLISVKAALNGVPGIAMGNVVGSNTANILLVLGIPALIAVMHTAEHDTRKSFVVMIAASLLFIALAFRGVFDWISGVILLGALALALADMFRDARKHKAAATLVAEGIDDSDDLDELEGADPDMPWWKIILFLVLGLAGLPLGADILVDSATVIARTFGISETVIGLTLVAVGTSMPELATTVMAAIRRQADVALGNVIGSNFFNLLGIIGVASLVAPIPVDQQFLTLDLWVMLAASLLLIPFVFLRQNIGRVWGGILIVLYVAYVWSMFL